MLRYLAISLLALAGCVAPVKYERPPVELPAAWTESGPRFAQDGRWWAIYGDAYLDKTIDEALGANADLLIAATFLAIFFVPMFFKLLAARRLRESRSTDEIREEIEHSRAAAHGGGHLPHVVPHEEKKDV